MSNKHYIIPIFVPHEGCPHDCVFCNQNSITGSTNMVNASFVRDTVDSYLETIKLSKHKNAIIEISFFGGTFTAIPMWKQKELLAVAKEYKNNKKINNIRLSTRPDYIDVEILNNLKAFDVDIIELGVQSLDEDVLLKSGRGHSVNDVIIATKLIKEYGFILGHQIMLGLPGDNFEKDINTTKQVIQLKPNISRIYPALIVKDTAMETMYKRGEYIPYTLEEAVDISKVVYGMLISNNIEVIRIGLQPTEEINEGGDIIDGPFHPSFRELVESSLLNDMIFEEIEKHKSSNYEIFINNKDISKLYAYKKKFFNAMISKSNKINLRVIQQSEVEIGNIMISSHTTQKTLNLKKYLCKKYEIQ